MHVCGGTCIVPCPTLAPLRRPDSSQQQLFQLLTVSYQRLILLRKLPHVHGVRVHSFAHAAHVAGCMVRGGPIRCVVGALVPIVLPNALSALPWVDESPFELGSS